CRDIPHLDVGEPQGPVRSALDDAAAEPGAQIERMVGGACRRHQLGPPTKQASVEGARPSEVRRMELEVHDGARHTSTDPRTARNQSGSDGFRSLVGSYPTAMSSTSTDFADSVAFEQLIQPYRAELHAHCYRMLGSAHDAEDALQDALLRAWRGLPQFEGRSSLRTWLYRIATHSCLRFIERRRPRVLPIDYGTPADPHDELTEPLVESVWIEPYSDGGIADGFAGPEARYEQRESVELAFVAALQPLPAGQR